MKRSAWQATHRLFDIFVRSKALPLCSLWQVEQASLLSSWSGTSRAQDATVKTNGTPIADGSTLSAVSDVSAAVSIPCGLNEFAPRSWQAMQSLLSDSLAECENAAIGQATIPFSNAVWQPLQSATSLCWNVTLPGLSRRGARGPPTTRSKKPMDIATNPVSGRAYPGTPTAYWTAALNRPTACTVRQWALITLTAR